MHTTSACMTPAFPKVGLVHPLLRQAGRKGNQLHEGCPPFLYPALCLTCTFLLRLRQASPDIQAKWSVICLGKGGRYLCWDPLSLFLLSSAIQYRNVKGVCFVWMREKRQWRFVMLFPNFYICKYWEQKVASILANCNLRLSALSQPLLLADV